MDQKTFEALQDMDFNLARLTALLDVLHTSLSGADRISLDTIGDYCSVMRGLATDLAVNLQTAWSAYKQDPEEDLEGAPLLDTDPETGDQKIFWEGGQETS